MVTDLIQCPDTKLPLRPATGVELQTLRERQAAGRLYNRLGRVVVASIEAGYVSDSSQCFYASVQGVLWLVAEEAIPLGSPEGAF